MRKDLHRVKINEQVALWSKFQGFRPRRASPHRRMLPATRRQTRILLFATSSSATCPGLRVEARDQTLCAYCLPAKAEPDGDESTHEQKQVRDF